MWNLFLFFIVTVAGFMYFLRLRPRQKPLNDENPDVRRIKLFTSLFGHSFSSFIYLGNKQFVKSMTAHIAKQAMIVSRLMKDEMPDHEAQWLRISNFQQIGFLSKLIDELNLNMEPYADSIKVATELLCPELRAEKLTNEKILALCKHVAASYAKPAAAKSGGKKTTSVEEEATSTTAKTASKFSLEEDEEEGDIAVLFAAVVELKKEKTSEEGDNSSSSSSSSGSSSSSSSSSNTTSGSRDDVEEEKEIDVTSEAHASLQSEATLYVNKLRKLCLVLFCKQFLLRFQREATITLWQKYKKPFKGFLASSAVVVAIGCLIHYHSDDIEAYYEGMPKAQLLQRKKLLDLKKITTPRLDETRNLYQSSSE